MMKQKEIESALERAQKHAAEAQHQRELAVYDSVAYRLAHNECCLFAGIIDAYKQVLGIESTDGVYWGRIGMEPRV